MENSRKVEIRNKLSDAEFDYNRLYFDTKYEDLLPKPNEQVTIIDAYDRVYVSKIHSKGCLIEGLGELYKDNRVEKNDWITIKLDKNHKDVIIVYFDKPEDMKGFEITPPDDIKRELIAANLLAFGQELTPIDNKGYRESDQCIDILCRKNNSDRVVIVLKKDNSNDEIVEKVSQGMEWVKKKLAPTKNVTGKILIDKSRQDEEEIKKLQEILKSKDNIEIRYYEFTLKIV